MEGGVQLFLEFRQGDEAYYHQWALRILGGEWGWGRAFFTTPFFAYFLALAYAAGGQGLDYVRLLNKEITNEKRQE